LKKHGKKIANLRKKQIFHFAEKVDVNGCMVIFNHGERIVSPAVDFMGFLACRRPKMFGYVRKYTKSNVHLEKYSPSVLRKK
jgi:hypothetical protein